MKNLYFIFLLFVSVNLSAQTKGITYQAIIYNPSGESIPGVNNATAPMANKSVCLQFSIIDASSQIEYQEAISTTTDEYGMVNLVIGNGVQSSGYASSFSTITWSVDQKSLKVALDIAGQCSDFVDISSQKFESVPYAFSANTADHISGILPIENGGTNATTVLDAKTNLGLENVDNTSDLNKPISNATQAALDIKEDQINKSALTTLGTSDVLYPTQNAVKTYVDAGTNNINAAITNEAAIRAAADATLTTNLATEVNNRINGDNTLTTNLATEVTNRINGDNTLTTNLATEVLNRTNADVVLTNNLATEVTNRTNADLLKEDLSNKSTATTLGTSDILYPTQNAVKTYVDVTSTTNTTAINNEAAIRAAADVVLTNNLATEVTNRANADLLKENLANKSTATTLGTSDVLYPSQNAVKTYVDANATTNATAISNEAAIRAAADLVLTNNLATEVTDRTNADLLKENLSNKSTSVNLGLSDVEYPSQKAVKTYVDAASNSTNNALNNEAIIRAAADNNLTINLAAEVSSRTIGDNNLNAAVLTEVTTRTNADLLKENLVNKSTSTALGTSDVLYPSQNAVKTYIDASALTINSTISNEASIRAAADLQLNTNLTSEINDREDADLLKEDLFNKSNNLLLDGTSTVKYPTVKTVKDYVDSNATVLATDLTNESLARAAGDNTLTTNLVSEANNRINADLLKENLTNKSTATTLGTSDVLYPTQNAVKSYVDATVSVGNAGINNEAAIRAAADAVLTTNLTTEIANRSNADLAKENLSNKSTATTLGTSNVLYPTQNAVKTYVDASTSAGTTGLSNEAAIRAAADVVLTNDIAAEAAARTAADATLTNDIVAEAAARIAADLLKENTANKSTATTLGTSDVLFPTQNAVKTYVDASTSAGTTGLNNEAAIRAAADVVLTNNIAAEAAARTAADATLITDLATEVTNRTNADLLKENLTNKSTATALGTSDVLYPTQNAVKTYVDAQVAMANIADADATTKGKLQLAGDLAGTAAAPTVPGLALKAPIASPTFTGTPAAPTAAAGTNTTQVATTEFVTGAIATATIPDADATTKGKLQLAGDLAGTAAAPTVPGLALKAPIASPTFTGTPAAPTAAAGTNTTQVATTEFVTGAIATATIPDATTTAKGKIQLAGDLAGTAAAPTVPGLALKAPIASPTFTGTVTSPIYASTPQALTDGTTISWNPTNGLNASVTLGGNRTLSFASLPAVGSYGTLIVTQDATGNRTITLPSTSNKVLGSASTTTIALSTAPNAKDILNFYYDGSNCYWNIGQGYGTAAAAVVTNLATGVSGTLPVANGGSGSTTLTGYVKGNGTSAMTANATIPVADVTGAAPIASPTFTGTPAAPTAAAGTNTTQVATTEFVTGAIATATIPDATTTAKGKVQLAGDLSGTAAAPVVAANAITTSKILDANVTDAKIATVSGSKVTGNITGSAANVTGTVAVANGGTGATTAAGALTNLGAAPIASPTFTGTVTAPIYASTPQALTDAATINWNPANGLNASVTLGGNRTLSFTSLPSVGSYGTLIVTQDATGNRTITLPSTSNKVLGSASTTTIALSTAANAKDILNFYYDGTNCYWNIGQGYGTAAPAVITNLATGVSGTLPVANGGTGAATLTGLVKGNGTGAMTAAVAGTDYVAPSGSITGNAANVTGTVAIANGGTGQTTLAGVKGILGLTTTNVAIGASSGTTNQGSGAVGVGNGTGQTNQGSQSVAIGYVAGNNNQGANSVAIGSNAAQGGQGTQSVAIGIAANSSANNATALGGYATAPHTNATAIGFQAATTANNTIQLGADGVTVAGSTAITNVKTSGTLTAGTVTYPNTHGTTGQVLSTTGSGTLTWVAPSASSLSGTVAVANGGTGATTASGALTNLGAAPIASPTFTGTVTAPIYASTPQALTDAATINWNPASGLNASVTLGGNRTLSFTSLPAVGSYGTLIVTQDATGNRTITLPTTANKVLGSASTTTIALSTTANAKDILNFYYDGTNCYWNIGQGYGAAAPSVVTNLATGVSGTLSVANGGTGAATLTGLVKGNGTGAMTAAVAGTDYVAPSGSITGNAANVTGTVAIANGGTGATTATGALTNLGAAPIASPTFTGTPAAPTATAGTNTTQVATTAFVTNALSSAGLPTQTGNSGKFLTTNGSVASWAASSGVPYTGATGAVNLGAYNLTVNELTIGKGNGSLSENTAFGKGVMANVTGNNNTSIGSQTMPGLQTGGSNTAIGSAAGYSLTTGSNNIMMGYNANMSGNPSNSIAIGTNIDVNTSNTIQLGNSSSTTLKTYAKLNSGTVTYPNAHNSVAGQVLTTDAAGVASWSTPSATSMSGVLPVANGGTGISTAPANGQIDIGNGTGFTRATLTAGSGITITNTAGTITITAAVRPTTDQPTTVSAGQTSFTLSQTPVNAKVWMFINGVRTNNNAYSISGTTVTYTPASNNGYVIVAGDRVQFDYCY